jgi:hypothetical protein
MSEFGDALRVYLRAPRELIFGALNSSGTSPDGHVDSIEIEVDVDLPQRPLYSIHDTERVRIEFGSPETAPRVFAIRGDFPLVPHLMLGEKEFPRELCLYERPWLDERSNWAPRLFVERIREWMGGTASGTLHRPDQPLEPLIAPSPWLLVLPKMDDGNGSDCWVRRFFVIVRSEAQGNRYLIATEDDPGPSHKTLNLPFIFVRGPVATHGILRRHPANLRELEEMVQGLGFSLVEAVSERLTPLLGELRDPKFSESNLILVLQLPKRRNDGGPQESTDYFAFVLGAKAAQLLEIEVSYVLEGGIHVPVRREKIRNAEYLASIPLIPMSVRWALVRHAAAAMNGYCPSDLRIAAIGMGSLGSQVTNHLIRSGFGKWTLIDPDTFEAHNMARHLAGWWAIGFNKAHIVSDTFRQLFASEGAPVTLSCNVLLPGDQEAQLAEVLRNADIVLDFSASVAVERHLASLPDVGARRCSAFLNPQGDSLIVLAEDRGRATSLFWLEAEYLRAVAFNGRLADHFVQGQPDSRRYGTACRETTFVLAQDAVAVHSGIAARVLRADFAKNEASIQISRLTSENLVDRINIQVSSPHAVLIGDWMIRVHPEAAAEMHRLRRERLPAETGGVMVGLVDRDHRQICVVCILPAPPDSREWPVGFIRGHQGLSDRVKAISRQTMGNLVYVGEWHSHPEGCSVSPSGRDWNAIEICSLFMQAEGIPCFMLIAGDGEALGIAINIDGSGFEGSFAD